MRLSDINFRSSKINKIDIYVATIRGGDKRHD